MTRRGCAGSTTFLLGSAANADAQNVNASTTLAHRIDAPRRRLNLFSILIPRSGFRSEFLASLFKGAIRAKKKDTFSIVNQFAQKDLVRSRRRPFAPVARLPIWVRHIEAGIGRA